MAPTYGAISVLGVAGSTAAVSVGNTTTETTLFSRTLPEGLLDVTGRNLHVRAWGTWVDIGASGSPDYTVRLKYGTTPVWGVSTATAITGDTRNVSWSFDCDVITTSSGNTRAYGWLSQESGSDITYISRSAFAVGRTPTTSGAVALTLTHQWASVIAGATWTCELATAEVGGLI